MENQLFQPTKAMQLYIFKRAQAGNSLSNRALAKEMGLAPETISRWRKINGFNEWSEEQICLYRAPIQEELMRIGRENISNPVIWKTLVENYGLPGTERPKEDFTFIMAYPEGELTPHSITHDENYRLPPIPESFLPNN